MPQHRTGMLTALRLAWDERVLAAMTALAAFWIYFDLAVLRARPVRALRAWLALPLQAAGAGLAAITAAGLRHHRWWSRQGSRPGFPARAVSASYPVDTQEDFYHGPDGQVGIRIAPSLPPAPAGAFLNSRSIR